MSNRIPISNPPPLNPYLGFPWRITPCPLQWLLAYTGLGQSLAAKHAVDHPSSQSQASAQSPNSQPLAAISLESWT